MKEFSFIKTSLWTDETFRQMTPEQKLVMLYLLQGTQTNWCGIFKLNVSMMGFFLGLRDDNVQNAFQSFVKHFDSIIAFDSDTSEVAILNWGAMNLANMNDKSLAAAKKDLIGVESETLILGMITESKALRVVEFYTSGLNSIRATRRNLAKKCEDIISQHPLVTDCESGSSGQKEREREMKKEICPATAEPSTPQQSIAPQEKERCTDVPPPPGFDEIWNLYGHKQQKADAIKAYKAMKSQSDRDALLASIPAYLTFLSLPDNSWRQKKLLGAFIRGRMWEDDFGAQKAERPPDMSDGNRDLFDFVSKEFPNVQKLKWLTNEQFHIFTSRGAEMFGSNHTVYASPIALKKYIRESFSELNSNSFKRSQYQDVYSYLCEDLKKRIYPK